MEGGIVVELLLSHFKSETFSLFECFIGNFKMAYGVTVTYMEFLCINTAQEIKISVAFCGISQLQGMENPNIGPAFFIGILVVFSLVVVYMVVEVLFILVVGQRELWQPQRLSVFTY